MNYDNIRAEGCLYDFDSFIPTESNPVPDNRIMDFVTVGPFVLETDGSFEAEHMYERDKLLLEDYLSDDGGEKNIAPRLGDKVRNNYYGAEYLKWEKGFIKWNTLRFDRDDEACDPALYATEQRNAVYYAAFYVDCSKDEKAIIQHEDSGCALFVNGELADFRPFGRVKGLDGLGFQCLVNFRKGRNLVLFKLRPGYIADTMDISISGCVVFPVILDKAGICVSTPAATYAYSSTMEKPRMISHIYAAAGEDTNEAVLFCDGEKQTVPPMKKGECIPLHIGIETCGKEELKKCAVSLDTASGSDKRDIWFSLRPYDGYEGNEHIMSDFHFDTTYHQEQRTYALGAFHITKSITEILESNPDFKAVLSEIDYLHPYYTLYPSHRKTLKEAFAAGRAEADCFYNQPNDLTSSGEAFVRNLVYGQLYHRDVMGRISRVYVPGDVFGHFSQMTQVCKKGGCDMVRWGKMVLGADSLFRHVSPDGSVLLHDKGIGRGDAKRFGVKGCAHSSEALSYIEAFPRYGDTSWMKNTLSNARFSVFSDMADDIIKSDKENISGGRKHLIDYSSRDLTQHHSGVLLTRTELKQANRLCENLLTAAEKFASMAFLYGAKYPEKALDKAWRQVLCAQHHDSITGTNNEISFVDLMIEYREAAQLASDVLERAAKYIASLVRTDNRKNALFVFNPAASDTKGVCRFDLPGWFDGDFAVLTDTKGKEYPVHISGRKAFFLTGAIPAVGCGLYRLEKRDADPDPVISGNDKVIENRYLKLTVDGTHGGIISIYDKKNRREIINPDAPASGNAVYALHEIHDRMETQHELYTDGLKTVTDEFDAEIASEKCGDYQKLIITSKLGTLAGIIREITLYKNSDVVDFRTVIEDYNSEDELFCAAFPVNINGGAVIYDDRFAPHVSTRSKKYMSFQTHQYASFSGCRVLPANRWFGVGPSVTVKMKNGSVNLGMTAIIRKNDEAVIDAADELLKTLSLKAVPVTLYPDTEQHGGNKIIHFNEDIYETDTRFVFSVSGDGNAYAGKLLDGFTDSCRSRINKKLSEKGIAVIYTKDSDNIYNKPVDVFLIIAENPEKLEELVCKLRSALASGYKINLDCIEAVHPGTADEYGASIINNGNISCSVENNNTLNLMLFHTAAFYGNMGKVTGGKELVPEKKTHIFTYAFYPHKGSFREADVYGRAAEFNETLFAVEKPEEKENAFLAEEHSFLRAPRGFEITAMKAGGYPFASMKNENAPASERGIVIRGYNSDGTAGKVRLTTGFEIKEVQTTDLLEENGRKIRSGKNSFTVPVGAHSIETFAVMPACADDSQSEILGAEKDLTEPTYVRSWEHDMGSLAMGYLKFAAALDKKPDVIDDTHIRVSLNSVNNSLDTPAKVNIKIECSEKLTAGTDGVSVSLEPGESSVVPFIVEKQNPDAKGQVKIYYTYDGQEFTDVYEIGYFNPEVSLRIEDGRIVCTVVNPTDQYLDASLLIASPFETWGDISGIRNAFGTVSPLSYAVHLAPGETKEYEFRADFNDENYFKAYYAAVKLCCSGRIHFAFCDSHGPRHNVWAHIFINEISADNGSIEKLLKM